jgi:ribosome assembly protein SQT1
MYADDDDDDDDDAQYADGEYADEDEDGGEDGGDDMDDGAQELSPSQDDSVGKFRGHTQAVFACATHGSVVLTGGEDDVGFLWELETQKIVAKLDGMIHEAGGIDGSLEGSR